MTKEVINNNRVLSKIDEQIIKGENFFILHGEEIDDLFFQDFKHGLVNILQLLKNYIVFNKIDKYAFFKNDLSYDNSIESNFKTQTNDSPSVARFIDDEENNNESNEGQNPDSVLVNLKHQVENNPDKKYCLVFKDCDRILNFYQDSQDKDSENRLFLINDFKYLKNCLVFIIQKKIEPFKKFQISIDEPNTIYVSKAKLQEVSCTILNKIFKGDISIDIKSTKELNDLSSSFVSSRRSLNQTITSFTKMVKQKNIKSIPSKDFDELFDKPIAEIVSFEDGSLILDEETKNKIKTRVNNFVDLNKIDFPKGIIFTGPPGTGKTQIARAIANDYKCYFKPIKLSDVKGQFVGESSQKTKAIFDELKANAPAILFVDEADTILTKRASKTSGDSFTRDIINEFLVSIDGAGTQKDRIFIVCATNRPEQIDDAIISRLGGCIEIPVPNLNNRITMFKKFFREDIDTYEWFLSFMERCDGMSGRDISEFCKRLDKKIVDSQKLKNDFEINLDTHYNNLVNSFKEIVENIKIKHYTQLNKSFKDIIGYEKEQTEIKNHIKLLFDKKNIEKLKELNLLKSGILLYGPPGNGKTTFAKCLAKEFDMDFIEIDTNTLLSSSNLIENTLVSIFEYAVKIANIEYRDSKGIIIFFDEFDALAVKDINRSLRQTFLTQLTKLKDIKPNVEIVAATNFIEQLDQAIIRRGRFDTKVCLNNPSKEECLTYIRQKLKYFSDKLDDFNDIDSEECYKKIEAEKPDNISYADLEEGIKDIVRNKFV